MKQIPKKIPKKILDKAIIMVSHEVAFIYIDKNGGFEVKPFSNYRFVKKSGIVDVAYLDSEGLCITNDTYYANMDFKRV